jgi:hypothetical protein
MINKINKQIKFLFFIYVFSNNYGSLKRENPFQKGIEEKKDVKKIHKENLFKNTKKNNRKKIGKENLFELIERKQKEKRQKYKEIRACISGLKKVDGYENTYEIDKLLYDFMTNQYGKRFENFRIQNKIMFHVFLNS